jgi:hypothetical protein
MIPKSEATKVAQETYEAAAKALEARIDRVIRENVGGSVYVDVIDVPRPAVDAVADKFRTGGWTVNYTDCQREGAALTLS